MENMVTNVYLMFNYDRLCIDKALGKRKQRKQEKSKNNVGSAWGPFWFHQLAWRYIGL